MIRSEKGRGRFMAPIIATFMLYAGFSLTGCSTPGVEKNPGGVEQTKQNQQTPRKASVVETTLDLVDQGETLELNFRLKNISDKSLSLLFGSGHQYDVIVSDSGGQEIYNWAADKVFTQALIEKNLAPDQELSYSEAWDYKGTDGKPLPPGKYLLIVTIIPIVENEELKGKVKDEDFTAVKEIEIRK